MSGRQYFELRNAIPGFVFLLLIIVINFFPLVILLQDTAFSSSIGIFLAVLSLFSGSAIGFLISQEHWHNWQKNFGILSHTEYEKSIQQFFKKFNIVDQEWKAYLKKIRLKNSKDDEWKRQLQTAIDYMSHYDADEKILKLSQRRWDMYHTLSATKTALNWGIIIGICLRALYIPMDILFFINRFTPNFIVNIVLQVTVLVLMLVLVKTLGDYLEKSSNWLKIMSGYLHKIRIMQSVLVISESGSQDNLGKIFPGIELEKTEVDELMKLVKKDEAEERAKKSCY